MKKITLSIIVALLSISMTVQAQVGINTTTPHAPLQFKNETVNRKIVLYETGNNDHQVYGFGVNPGVLRYQTDVTTSDHAFFAGTSATTSNELMRIKGTGNVGIGTSTPSNRLDLGTSLGTSITDVAGKKLAVYNAPDGTDFYGLGISPGFLQFHSASTAAEAPGMVLTSSGNVGIANIAPSNTLDVAGTTRVRTINAIAENTVTTPVYVDANGVLVKMNPTTFGTVISSTSSALASGATGTLITGLVQGAVYKAVVTVYNGCTDLAIADYYIYNGAYPSIGGQGGVVGTGGTAPTFTRIDRLTTKTTWTSVSGCQDGSSTNGFDYTISISTGGTVNITNNGNVTKSYKIVLTRMN